MSLEDAAAKDLVPVIAVTMGCLIAIILPVTYMITSNWRKVRQHEQNAVLKKVMLDRGMNAQEIAVVISSGNSHEIFENEEAVKTMKQMIRKGYSVDEIAKLVGQSPERIAKINA